MIEMRQAQVCSVRACLPMEVIRQEQGYKHLFPILFYSNHLSVIRGISYSVDICAYRVAFSKEFQVDVESIGRLLVRLY